MKHVQISQHAIERYRNRFCRQRMPDRCIVSRLIHYWSKGAVIERDLRAISIEFLLHGAVGQWREHGGVIMIVVDDVMVTVMRHSTGQKQKFIKRRNHHD